MSVTETTSGLPGYYNRMGAGGSPTRDRWVDLRFRAGYGLQAAELNELQTLLNRNVAAMGSALFKEGGIINGSVVKITGGEGVPNLAMDDGYIYFAGAIHQVPGETLQIPLTGKVLVGIRYRQYEVTEETELDLRDPAPNGRNYQEPGAARRIADWLWGWIGDTADDGKSATVDADGNKVWSFFPIYTVQDGFIVVKDPPPVADAVLELVATYDRESNGNYVDNGLLLEYSGEDTNNYTFNLREGKANIYGYKIELRSGRRLTYPKNFDVNTVSDESHTLTADTDGKATIWLNRDPMAAYSRLKGAKQKTVTLTRDSISLADEVPDATITTIVEVKQGSHIYTPVSDYNLIGDRVTWTSPSVGPSAGSSYTVKYQYRSDVTPVAVFPDHLVFNTLAVDPVNGLVSGQLVEVDYTYKLPRVDLLVLDRQGNVLRIQGTPQRRNPVAPKASDLQIALAEIHLSWVEDPEVRNISVRAMTMADIQTISQRQEMSFDLIAQLELKTGALITDPGLKKGVFVDPFRNDDLRDQGTAQNGAIGDGTLNLPIVDGVLQPSDVANRTTWHTLPFSLESVIEQPNKTGCMKINPYQAFDPTPAKVTLTPASDFWVTYVAQWLSPIWQYFTITHWDYNHRNYVYHSTQTQLLSRAVRADTVIRQRNVGFVIEGFGPGETLLELTFDGLNVTPP